jgi:hypothetical protein
MKHAQNAQVAVLKPRVGTEPTTVLKHKAKAAEQSDTISEAQREKDRYAKDLANAEKLNQEFVTIAEKIAKTNIYIKNITVDALVQAFPGRFMDWCVSQVFPHAAGGPLFVDNAYYEYDKDRCRIKASVMRKAGLRYLWLESDDTVDSAERKLRGDLK